MKLPDYNSPEEFVGWLLKQTNAKKPPTEEEWKEIRARLEKATKWLNPWYLREGGDDGDGGGGEDSIPPDVMLTLMIDSRSHNSRIH